MYPILAAHMSQQQALVAVLRWSRSAGWQRTGWNATWWHPASGATVQLRQELVDRTGGPITELLIRRAAGELPTFVPVRTVREAVGVLVAVGLLPPELSPAYTAGYGGGWRARATRPDPVGERLTELAHFIGQAQVILFSAHIDPGVRVGELRQMFARAGHGNPWAQMVAAHTEERITVGGGSR